jgi:GMP synthase (glutamine-hydrolysing)
MMVATSTNMNHETLVILDYGSQYTKLIARRVRELGVYSVILPFSAKLSEIEKLNPKGIVLSGGPNSVYDKNAPDLDNKVSEMGLPILGICYGLQLFAKNLGGKVTPSTTREYGLAKITLKSKSSFLPANMNGSRVWMSHGDHVAKAPSGFTVTAMSGAIICAAEDAKRKLFGIQFHPEVSHTEHGAEVLKNFLKICGFKFDWNPTDFINETVENIKTQVGDAQVICALSGGVDSSVAATLVNKAIGDRQTCIFVDTGLLRQNEVEEVVTAYKKVGLNLKLIDASKQFLGALKGTDDPEKKRKIIGAEFIKVFDAEAKKIKDAKFLVQGTLYPDVIESVSVNGPSVTIKSHHNVGGLPDKMNLKLLEPLRELFKDEVRLIGGKLGLPQSLTQRQPFPGPGLAVRILGPVTEDGLDLLRRADAIVREEIIKAQAHNDLWQYFAVLLPIKSVGVMGDNRTYEQAVAIRVVESTDGMTADWAKLPHELIGRISSRIVSEIRGINRVVYDVTSKPPGTIEWE